MQLYEITNPSPRSHQVTASSPGTVEEVEIALDAAVLDRAPSELGLALPDGRRLTAVKSYFAVQRDHISWAGSIRGADGTRGHMHLLDRGESVLGVLKVGSECHEIVPSGFTHRLVRIESGNGSCFHGDQAQVLDHRVERPRSVESPRALLDIDQVHTADTEDAVPSSTVIDRAAKSITYIDVLAVYPSVFPAPPESGGALTPDLVKLFNFIDMSISMANEVFANSQVDIRYNLVAKVRLEGDDQPLNPRIDSVLSWMTPIARQTESVDLDDVGPQELLDVRDRYAADMVAMFVPFDYDGLSERICGIANLPLKNGDVVPTAGDFGRRAFSVHRNGCGLCDYTFAHELGHNFGMRHAYDNPNVAPDPALEVEPDNRGHLLSFNPWQNLANGTLETNVSGDFTVGYEFTSNAHGYVVALGGLFNGERTVHLWDEVQGTPLTSISVHSNNSWVYEDLGIVSQEAPLVPVIAGRRYTVSAHFQGGGSIYSNIVPFPRTTGHITIHGTVSSPGGSGGPIRPTQLNNEIMYGQLDIGFVPAAALASSVMGCADPIGDIGSSCHRIPYFSDPNISFDWYSTGTSTRNNAQLARERSPSYADYRIPNTPACRDDQLDAHQDTTREILHSELLGDDISSNEVGLRLASFESVTTQGGTNSQVGHVLSFEYTPPPGFHGEDWFEYTVEGSTGLTDTCMVHVTVIPTPTSPFCIDDPENAGDPRFMTTQDTDRTILISDLLENDDDLDDDTVMPGVIGMTSARGATITRFGGELTYNPPSDLCGTDTFNYTVTAGGETTDPCQVTVQVTCPNRPPTCVNDNNLSTPEGTQLSVSLGDLLGNDSDPDLDPITLHSYDLTTANGGINDTGHSGGFNYTPPSDGFTGIDTFSYTIEDDGGLTDSCTAFVTVTPAPGESVMGEVGQVTDLSHIPQTVMLQHTYSNPVVIAQPPTQNGADTSVVRITDVQPDRFTAYVHEAPDRDGTHTTETVTYLVVEAGSWTLKNGTELRAGRRSTPRKVSNNPQSPWNGMPFGGTFQTIPVVFSQVQSNADPGWVKTRHNTVRVGSFRVALEAEEAATTNHARELVGWVAIAPSTGTWNGRPYVASRTSNQVTDAWHTISFPSVGATPHFLAAMPTYQDADSAHLRYRNLTTNSVDVRVEEDTTFDAETVHPSETVDYLIFGGGGLLVATPN